MFQLKNLWCKEMKKNPIFSFIWVTILFNYKDYQIKVRNGMWNARRRNLGK